MNRIFARLLAAVSLLLAVVAAPASAQVIQSFQPSGDAATIATVRKWEPQGVFTPWQPPYGATEGDCTTDNSAALAAAAAAAQAGGGILWTGDSCLAHTAKFAPPAGLIWRSDFSDAHALIYTGNLNSDQIEVTGRIDIDGVVLDGGRSGSAVRTSDSVSLVGTPFGVHGSVATSAASYLTGVTINRLRIEHAQARAAAVFGNLKDARIGTVEVKDNWGAAVMLSGIKDSKVRLFDAYDVGSLGTKTNRNGQVVAIFTESDPTKTPAQWYTISSQSTPNLNFLPTDNLQIGEIRSFKSTDTGTYIHDYDPTGGPGPGSGVTGAGTGTENIHIGRIDSDTVGKDAFKVRHNAGKVTVDEVICRRIAARCTVIEDYAYNVRIGRVDSDQVGYDAVGDILGTPAPYDGGTGAGLSISDNSDGIDVNQYATGVWIGAANIRRTPVMYDGTSQGYCVHVLDATDVHIKASCDTSGNSALRMGDVNRFDIEIDAKDANRTTGANAIYITNDNASGEVQNGRLSYNVWESTGTAVMQYALRLNSAPHDITFNGSARAADFTRPGFNGVISIVPSTLVNIFHNPLWQTSQAVANATTDASGLLGPYTINAHSTVVIDFMSIVGTAGYRVTAYAVSSSSVTFKVWDTSGAAVVSTNVGTFRWGGHVADPNGY